MINYKMETEEVWKEVKGYEGYYWISNMGRIKSKFRMLKGYAKGSGHMEVTLSKLGCLQKYHTHRLVAETFLEGYEPGNVADHIDRNPTNNSVKNLRWVTQRENCWNRRDKSNSSAYKYVTKRGERYTFTISRTFGSFATAKEAHDAAIKYLQEEDVSYNKYKHLKTEFVDEAVEQRADVIEINDTNAS
jgi:hypothetical protein